MGPVYRTYLDALIRNNRLDYGALLVSRLRLFGERPRIAKHYRIVYPYICVDEYQDTNKCQDGLLRFLCPRDTANLFVVADDDQIIFSGMALVPRVSKSSAAITGCRSSNCRTVIGVLRK